MPQPAVVLTSGGLDSTTLLAIVRDEGREANCLTLDYGQSHQCELYAARNVARTFGAARHIVAKVELSQFGGSALTGDEQRPLDRSIDEIAQGGIPATYVPARNTVFLSMALSWAEALGVHDIFIGVNAIDYSGYPDCRPEYIAAFERLANLATREGAESQSPYRIHTPLIELTKAQIIRTGLDLGVDYSQTHSCYFPNQKNQPCGKCDSCRLRLKGFAEAGAKDPVQYCLEDAPAPSGGGSGKHFQEMPLP